MDSWIKDNPDLSGEGMIYRRIRRIPEHYTPVDPVSGRPQITNATLTYRGDGMSIALGEIMEREQVHVDELADLEKYAIARCEIRDIRQSGAGVIDAPVQDDLNEARGRAHGLVRTDAPPPDRARWLVVRDGLRRRMAVLDRADGSWVNLT